MGCVYDLYCAALAPQKSQSRLEGGKKVEKATNAFCAGFSRASDEARRCLLAISGSRPHPVHLTPTFLGPSACSLLSDVQTSFSLNLSLLAILHCGSSTSPPPSIGHLLKQGVPKELLTVPHPHHWPSAYILLSDVPCVTCVQASSRFNYSNLPGGALLSSLTITLIHQIIDQHHLKGRLGKGSKIKMEI